MHWIDCQRRRSSANYEMLLLRRRFNDHIREELSIRGREVLLVSDLARKPSKIVDKPTRIRNLNRNIRNFTHPQRLLERRE